MKFPHVYRNSCAALAALLIGGLPAVGLGQTNPTAQTLPFSQNWGTAAFSSLTSFPGFAAWDGLSGASITTQALAEASVPTADAAVSAGTPTNGGGGGCYGDAPGGNAHFTILQSGSSLNGVNQLALAINTAGQTAITLTYTLTNIVVNPRGMGIVCQYRVGTSGAWTTLSGTNTVFTQTGLVGDPPVTASATLPVAAENQAVVQIRWADWRPTGTGNSCGMAIDNIAMASSSSGPSVSSIALSGGPTYNLGDAPSVTVNLSAAPASTATVNVSSGAFTTQVVTITAPATSGVTDVSMSTAGSFTATATAATGCSGAATSTGFNVMGAAAPAFSAAGGNTVDDSAGNTNGAIDPNESGVNLTIPIINSGNASATGISGTLSSLTGGVTVTTATRSYPNLAVSVSGSNTLPFVISAGPSVACGTTITFQLAVTAAEGSSTFNVNFIACPPQSGDIYDPPSDYYLTATGTGATLKTNLHNIIDKDYWNGFLASTNHHVRTYDDARVALQLTDIDTANTSHLILIYTGVSVLKTWDAGVTWNREHQWPQAQGVGSSGPAFSDLHHLRPCNPSINSSRGNSSFGVGSGYFDPDHGLACRGRTARTTFYMSTRYNGDNPANINLVLVNGQPPSNTSQLGDLAELFQWHYAYPVDLDERRRNATVFSNSLNPSYYQGNRNPYVDHPEYVWTIFGSGPNDSKLYVGSTAPPDGASTNTVNLGSVLVGAAAPSPQSLTLNKIGAAPTTYDVSLTGLAVSNAVGPRQAFIAGTQSRSITAGLSATTATAGLKSGSITIDNTDLTSSTNGTGSADGNDVVSISETVLDHANASFATPSDQNALTINFGSVTVGGAPVNQNFTIYDLASTPGFTASLDLDSVSSNGDTSKLTINVTTPASIAAGGSQGYTATLAPNAVGTYSATYTLANSDQNLPGAQNGTNLVLTLSANVVSASCNAFDVNCDTFVNAADLTALASLLINGGTPCSTCAGDGNGDLVVNGTDIQVLVTQIVGP